MRQREVITDSVTLATDKAMVNDNFAATIHPEVEAQEEEGRRYTTDKMNSLITREGTALSSQEAIEQVCDQIKAVLIEKNKRYGDSALKPKKIFNKLSADQSILVRLDDKIGRIMNSEEIRKNDVADIIGYLVLLCVSRGWIDLSDQID